MRLDPAEVAMLSALIVDGEPVIRRFAGGATRLRGHRAQAVGSHDEAMALAQLHHFDVAVVDLILGPSNGFDLVVSLRALVPCLSCVLITGFGEYAVPVSRLTLAGGCDFLLKPFS